jgi:hypothetical protein
MIGNLTIDQPVLLEIIIVSKNRPLFVQHLSVFFGVVDASKVRSPTPPTKYWWEELNWTPYLEQLFQFEVFPLGSMLSTMTCFSHS